MAGKQNRTDDDYLHAAESCLEDQDEMLQYTRKSVRYNGMVCASNAIVICGFRTLGLMGPSVYTDSSVYRNLTVYRTLGLNHFLRFKRNNHRSIGHSVYGTLGLSDPRSKGLSV